jgi:DNA-binding LytR/AlgR family response regulator
MTPAAALIAEDEPLLAAGLQAELAAQWPGLRVLATVGDGASAVAQGLALRPDVCFFDIRMPGQSGLDAASALAEDWADDVPFPLLVFITAFDQYALQAFDAEAVDYLVKPVEPARLAACVKRLQKRLSARHAAAAPADDVLLQAVRQLRGLLAADSTHGATSSAPVRVPRLSVLQAQVGAVVHLVPVDEVLYFEAADKYVRVVCAEREHLIRLPLKELLPQLDPQQFWQVHRGTVVQARAIASARRDESGKVYLTLRGRTETLVASRLYAHLFKGM